MNILRVRAQGYCSGIELLVLLVRNRIEIFSHHSMKHMIQHMSVYRWGQMQLIKPNTLGQSIALSLVRRSWRRVLFVSNDMLQEWVDMTWQWRKGTHSGLQSTNGWRSLTIELVKSVGEEPLNGSRRRLERPLVVVLGSTPQFELHLLRTTRQTARAYL